MIKRAKKMFHRIMTKYMNQKWVAALLMTVGLCRISAGADQQAVNGTTGTPLGGFGAGGVKFNANDGSFAVMMRPPADAYDFEKVKGAGFLIAVERKGQEETVHPLKAECVDGRPDDDAIWPIHRVNCGAISDIQVQLLAFSPLDRTDPDKMSLPCAFYEVTLKNTGSSEAEVTCELKWPKDEKSWAIASSDRTVKLAVQETKTIRFVLAWYQDQEDPEIAHYLGRYEDAKSIAKETFFCFDAMKETAVTLVERMRGSNLPDWFVNQTQNTLANLTLNSMYKKDGRVGFAEGQWTCFGTMDQMWHARQIVGQLIPFFAWEELRYWARTQMKNGQIHHDFNQMAAGDDDKAARSVLVDWDDTEHEDYRNIQKWVDLNCGLIISTYETYQITGDRAQFEVLWPYVKKAAQRVLDQVEAYGSEEYPFTFDESENSYDAGGDPNPFNASMSAVAYKVMVEMAKEKGESALASSYQKAYETVVESYRARYLKNGFAMGKHAEGYFAGQWLALNLKLGGIWTQSDTDAALAQLDDHYHPYYWGLGNEAGTYDEWSPYILTHYAGLLLNTRRANQWEVMLKDAYERQYFDRDRIFDHPLNILPKVTEPKWISKNYRSGKQYISMPGLWRNYYDIVGYHRDVRTKELWLQPILPPELNHRLMNAFYMSPEGDGTVSCIESGAQHQNRQILFKPDRPINVSVLHLSDLYGENVTVTIDGKTCDVKREGAGYSKVLSVALNRKVGTNGLRVEVSGDPGAPAPSLPKEPGTVPVDSAEETAAAIDAFKTIEAKMANRLVGTKVADGNYVTSCNNFDYIQFNNVDFGSNGAVEFIAHVSSCVSGSSIEIVLDDVSNEAIGKCLVPNTGGDAAWKSAVCNLTKITGVHDVILRFYGTTQENLMNLNWIRFSITNQ